MRHNKSFIAFEEKLGGSLLPLAEPFLVASRLLWIALVVVFIYVLARPHLGTVYYVSTAHMRFSGATKSSLQDSTSLGRSLLAPAAPLGVKTTFVNQSDCEAAAATYDADNHVFGASCAPRPALLWGW